MVNHVPSEPTTAPRNLARGILVFAMLPLLLALFAVGVTAVLGADLSGSRQLPKEQHDELPANLDIVESVESCGQGRRPVDCGAVVITAGSAGHEERSVLEEVRKAWCRDPWRCEQDDDGQVVGSHTSFWDGKTRCRYGSAALVVFQTGRTTAS
jgi:hypothetical protein